MDLDFTSDDRRFRSDARDWLQSNVPSDPPPVGSAELRAFELAWQKRQHEGGWTGISWPEEYGGQGLSLTRQLIWFEEYARSGAPPVGCLVIAVNHGGPTLILHGNEAQKAFHLPLILQGNAIWCQGFSEPSAGSDLASLRMRGVVDGDHLVVTGQKIWTSYADISDYQELLVRTDPSTARHNGLTWIICDMRLPGITVRPIRTMAGHEHFCEVFYDEVRIPLANVVGGIGNGWQVAMATLGFERGTGYVGHLSRLAYAIEDVIELARSRGALDDEVATRLGLARAECSALRAMTYVAISRPGGAPGPEGSIIALGYGELTQRVSRIAVDVLGGGALLAEGTNDRWVHGFLDSFRQTIAGGTSEIRRNIIGERVLGLARG